MFKRALLFFTVLFCIFFTYFGRFQPISLELAKPSLKQVEIKGEVKEPGVYSLKWGATTQDAINQAGGLTPQADVSSLSLLEEIEPEATIYIPSIEKTKELISLNDATLKELDSLPGVGPSIAQRILDYRKTQPFTKIEDLMNVKGIGEKSFVKLKDLVCL